jgi:hypothetical protein
MVNVNISVFSYLNFLGWIMANFPNFQNWIYMLDKRTCVAWWTATDLKFVGSRSRWKDKATPCPMTHHPDLGHHAVSLHLYRHYVWNLCPLKMSQFYTLQPCQTLMQVLEVLGPRAFTTSIMVLETCNEIYHIEGFESHPLVWRVYYHSSIKQFMFCLWNLRFLLSLSSELVY